MTRTELIIQLRELKRVTAFKSKEDLFEFLLHSIELNILISTSYFEAKSYQNAMRYAIQADVIMRDNYKFLSETSPMIEFSRVFQLIAYKKNLLELIPLLKQIVKLV